MRFAAVVLFALALYGRTAHCSEDDYDPDGPGDEDEYGGGHDHGGEDEDKANAVERNLVLEHNRCCQRRAQR